MAQLICQLNLNAYNHDIESEPAYQGEIALFVYRNRDTRFQRGAGGRRQGRNLAYDAGNLLRKHRMLF